MRYYQRSTTTTRLLNLIYSHHSQSVHSFQYSCFSMKSLFFVSPLLWASAMAQSSLPVLLFNGRVINDLGKPLEGAEVQFWHTDENGNYDHPNFSTGGTPLLSDFQYFGTATTDSDGGFVFKTYRPGVYPQRPVTHIHYKVWLDGNDVLTSQFYFVDENTSQPASLQLTLEEQDDGSVATNKTIALNLGLGGSEPITPSQQAGPFYPTVDFFNFDSDMTVVTADEERGTPTGNGDEGAGVAEEETDAADGPAGVSPPPSESPAITTVTTAPTASDATNGFDKKDAILVLSSIFGGAVVPLLLA